MNADERRSDRISRQARLDDPPIPICVHLSLSVANSPSLAAVLSFGGHGRGDGRGLVTMLAELDPVDHVFLLGLDGEVADLLAAAEPEGVLRAGYIDFADVVGEHD